VFRAREIELGFCALVPAPQQLMATIPLLVVLAALRPVAGSGNFGGQLGRYLWRSAAATRELESVFAGSLHVRSAVTIDGVILLASFPVATAQAPPARLRTRLAHRPAQTRVLARPAPLGGRAAWIRRAARHRVPAARLWTRNAPCADRDLRGRDGGVLLPGPADAACRPRANTIAPPRHRNHRARAHAPARPNTGAHLQSGQR
jgi:hypothetical protein